MTDSELVISYMQRTLYCLLVFLLINPALAGLNGCQVGNQIEKTVRYQDQAEQQRPDPNVTSGGNIIGDEQAETNNLLWQMLQRSDMKDKEYTYYPSGPSGPRTILKYGSVGHNLETTTISPGGALIRRWNYQYDSSARKIEGSGYDATGCLVQKQQTMYNKEGKVIKTIVSIPFALPSRPSEEIKVQWNLSLKNGYLFDHSRNLSPAWQSGLTLSMHTDESLAVDLSIGYWSAYVTQQNEILGELKQWEQAIDLIEHTQLGQTRIYGGPGVYLLNYQQCTTKFQRDFKTEDTVGFQLRLGWEYPVSQEWLLGLESGYRWNPAVNVLDKPRGIDIDRLDFSAWIFGFTIMRKF